MPIPHFARQDFLALESGRPVTPPRGEDAPSRDAAEALRPDAAPSSAPPFARPLAVLGALLALAGCGSRPEPARPLPPAVEPRSAFLDDVMPRLAALCPYSAPLVSFDEAEGVRHVALRGCEALPRIEAGPKVKRIGPKKTRPVVAAVEADVR